MEIFTEETKRVLQMFAQFDLSIIEGVMRFERQQGSGKSSTGSTKGSGSNEKKCKREDSEDEDESDEDEDEYDSRSPTPEAFFLGKVVMPSQKHSNWIYRWRGKETGQGEI